MDSVAYLDHARSGAENMAIDRQLLEEAERTGQVRARVYQWSEPTLSLGHFQAGIDRRIHLPSSQLAMVVRASGGGAIVHHSEWTYAVAMRVGRNKVGAATELYDAIHDSIVGGLQSLGWKASKWAKPTCDAASSVDAESRVIGNSIGLAGCSNGQPASGPGAKDPFLCFQRRSCGDIVVGGYKVVGSAQRRLGASVLQHGSVLWARSPYAPELPGLIDLPRELPVNPAAAAIDLEQLGELLLSWIGNPIGGAN